MDEVGTANGVENVQQSLVPLRIIERSESERKHRGTMRLEWSIGPLLLGSGRAVDTSGRGK